MDLRPPTRHHLVAVGWSPEANPTSRTHVLSCIFIQCWCLMCFVIGGKFVGSQNISSLNKLSDEDIKGENLEETELSPAFHIHGYAMSGVSEEDYHRNEMIKDHGFQGFYSGRRLAEKGIAKNLWRIIAIITCFAKEMGHCIVRPID